MTTMSQPDAKSVLEFALQSFLAAVGADQTPDVLYQLYYEQLTSSNDTKQDGSLIDLPVTPPSLIFDDSILDSVKQAWKVVVGDAAAAEEEFMTFPNREGAEEEDDVYD